MGGRMPTLVAVMVGALLVATGWAWAGGKPKVAISGVAQGGSTLTAHADYEDEQDASASAAWQWLRCRPDKPGSCETIPDAISDSYLVATADVGFRLRVRLTFVDEDGKLKDARSKPTAIVSPAPIEPPTPSPSPAPLPPVPTPPPIVEPPPPPAPQPRVRPRLLYPFPTIRIRGRLTRTGARVTLLTVRAPRGARISARCYGRSCPPRRLAVVAAVKRLKRFERRLRAGTRLVIKITKPGFIGKWSVITIRRGRPPRRSDRCVYPEGRRPVRCPTR